MEFEEFDADLWSEQLEKIDIPLTQGEYDNLMSLFFELWQASASFTRKKVEEECADNIERVVNKRRLLCNCCIAMGIELHELAAKIREGG